MSLEKREDPKDDGLLQDLLSEVQADWKALGDGDSLPPVELEAQDPETRSAVSWMQDAWASTLRGNIPPMPLALARAHGQRTAPAKRRRVLWVAAGLAAAALAIAGASLLPHGPKSDHGAVTGGRIAAGPRVSGHGTPTAVTPTPLDVARAATPIRTFTPDQFISRPDGVEIVTGKVRIVLLQADR